LTTFFVYLRTYGNRIGPNWFFFLVGTCTEIREIYIITPFIRPFLYLVYFSFISAQ